MKNEAKLNKSNIEDVLALSPMQAGMFFHYVNNPESSQYLEQLSVRLSGQLDIATFSEAWNWVALENPALRTIFRWENLDKPVQIICKEPEIPVSKFDFSLLGEEEREGALKELRESDRSSKVDLASEPFRITLCKLGEASYEVFVTNHHILYDGWSNGILIKEFLAAYHALCNHGKPVKKQKTRFKEYLKWLNDRDKEEQNSYWQNYLQGFTSKTALPTSPKKKREIQSATGYRTQLSNTLVEKVRALVQHSGITLAAVMYAAWGILLQRYQDAQDVVFGTTVAGRTADVPGIEDIIGLFINTLPLRVSTTATDTVEELLKKVNTTIQERTQFESTPLVNIKSISELPATEALFDSIVIVENYPIEQVWKNTEGRLVIESYELWELTNFDLALVITDFDRLEINLMYNAELFTGETIARLSWHLVTILESLVADLGKLVSEVEMLLPEEKKQILGTFNQTARDFGPAELIHQIIEAQVERTPEAIAWAFHESSLCYADMNARANQLARLLRDRGVRPGIIVGLAVNRSLEMIIGILAILKAGGAYLPIDPHYPVERIEYMLTDSAVPVLLTQSTLSFQLSHEPALLYIDDLRLYQGEQANLVPINHPTDLAYVIYTSGSTGKPKGIMIEHWSVNNLIKDITTELEYAAGKTFLSLTTISFDIFVMESLLPLSKGLKVVLADEVEQKVPKLFNALLKKHQVDMINTTPSLMQLLISDPEQVDGLQNVKEILLGGEAFPEPLYMKLKSLSEAKIYNFYGPTETTVYSSWKELTEEGIINIGRPIANTQMYILDKNFHPTPVQVVGELYIAGAGLARGYWHREELTAERFISNPFTVGTRMYKTGDLARWLPNGEIECWGRSDSQVKIRGMRMELGEIEQKLLQHLDITEAVVLVKEEPGKDKFLCAYFTARQSLAVPELRAYLSRELPDAMIPARFLQMDKFPLTPSGKIDRKSLPEIGREFRLTEESAEPTNQIEESILTVWKNVLGLEKPGLYSNFFDLGGNSILLVQVQLKLEKIYPGLVTMTDLFAYPTIDKLAKFILKKQFSSGQNKSLPTLALPGDYFTNGQRAVCYGGMVYKLKSEHYAGVQQVAEHCQVEPLDIFIAAWVHLLSEVSGQVTVPLQVMSETPNMINSLSIGLNGVADFRTLVESVHRSRKDHALQVSYSVAELGEFKANREVDTVAICVVRKDLLQEQLNLTNFFDIAIEIDQREPETTLTCEFEARKLNGGKMKELLSMYQEIISIIASEYKLDHEKSG